MTRLDRASDAEYNARIKRRKRIGADLGLIAGGAGAAGFAIKGGGMASKKLAPKSIGALKNSDALVNRTSGAALSTSGAAGAGSALNNNLITQHELKRNDGKRKEVYRVKGQLKRGKNQEITLVRKSLNSSRKKYMYENNVEQRRNMRNDALPAAAATGSAVTGAVAARPVANKAFQALDSYRGKQESKLSSAQNRKARSQASYNKSQQASKKPLRGAAATSNSTKRAKGLADVMRDAGAEKKAARGVKYASKGQKLLKPMTNGKSGKSGIGMGIASAGLAATAAISHRNNKKGVTRPRHDWWQG
jgi:hypothetical protein